MSIPRIRTALEAGDLATAERLAREAIESNAEDALAHAYLGSIFAGRGEASDALAHYWAAVALRPNEAVFHNELGNALASVGDFDAAEKSLREAARLSAASPELNTNLGNILRGLGRPAAAAAQLLGTLVWFEWVLLTTCKHAMPMQVPWPYDRAWTPH